MKRIFSLAVFGLLYCFLYTSAVVPLLQEEDNRIRLSAQSDSLFAAGVDFYRQGKYEEAIPLFAESDSIDKAILDSTSLRRDYSAMWLASCYYQLKDSVKAQAIHEYFRFTPVDRRLTVRSDSLSAVGTTYFEQGDYAKALEYFLACGEIEKNVVGENHIWYGNTASSISKCYYYLGNTQEAIRFEMEALTIRGKTSEKDYLNYATSLNGLALYNSSLGNYAEAIRLGTEALQIREKILGKENPDYAQSLNNVAFYNSSAGNYGGAVRE